MEKDAANTKGAKNPHDGHRERMREKFLNQGFEHWHDHEILEMLLYHTISRGDTNPVAHALIDEFKNLAQVLEADVSALMKVPGVGKSTAVYLHMLGQMIPAYHRSKWSDVVQLTNSTACGMYCASFLGNETVECFGILCFDTRRSLKKSAIISRGVVDQTVVYVRKVVETALSVGAKYVILTHNHPSGNLSASGADLKITADIQQALSSIDIVLLDHIIVCGQMFSSLSDRGLMP